MGVPWKKIFGGIKSGATFGAALGIPFAGPLIQAMHIVEVIPGLKGPQKKDAAKAIAAELIGDDGILSQDPELARLTDVFIDAYVALMNRIAELRNN